MKSGQTAQEIKRRADKTKDSFTRLRVIKHIEGYLFTIGLGYVCRLLFLLFYHIRSRWSQGRGELFTHNTFIHTSQWKNGTKTIISANLRLEA